MGLKHRKKSSKYRRWAMGAAASACLAVLPCHGHANDVEYVYHDGKPFVELNFLGTGEGLGTKPDYILNPTEYALNPVLIDATKSGTSYWAGILGPRAQNGQPWQIFITTKANYQNAAAGSAAWHATDTKVEYVDDSFVTQLLQKGKNLLRTTVENVAAELPPAGDYGISHVVIGQHMGANRSGAVDGWWVDTDTVLPTNEQANDYVATVRHELGHALGILAHTENLDSNGNVVKTEDLQESVLTEDKDVRSRFTFGGTDPNRWITHLVDQNLNPAKPGMWVVTPSYYNALKLDNPSLKESDFFIVSNPKHESGLSERQGSAYFIGQNVTEVLDGATFNGVSGLPVKGWEGRETYHFEGSHLQTTGMMSHRPYSNYTSFMEVELAVMQDLGYNFDRKAYFGRSVYRNDSNLTNTQGYFARNAEGTAYLDGTYSQVPLGIGLHIYGSRNTVTQAADILTQGTGATGIRVDGVENRLVIPSATNIHADGYRGNGVLVAYGRRQNIDQAGTVTATGAGGVGVRFDFGSSSNGALDEYRGSYIRYQRSVGSQSGTILKAENKPLTDMDQDTCNASADELDGAMVENYDLSGTLAGGEHAIYIGKNAFVKNINVNDGASIRGDITSDWKHFHTDGSYDASRLKNVNSLKIQYGGRRGEDGYSYDAYIPDLVTDLNFNAVMAYDGNINGTDNMKMNVKGGSLVYGGRADVVNVTVDKGAGLFGGDYAVNDMSSRMAEGFSDDTTGKFINHGMIGSAYEDRNMNITGELVSDGVLSAYGGGTGGYIQVNGPADVNGSTASATNMMPGETHTLLVAEKLTGELANSNGKTHAATAMLDTTGAIQGNTVTVTATAANHLGDMTEAQSDAYEAVEAMHTNLAGDARQTEMRRLYNLDADSAKSALSDMSANDSTQAVALAQQSTVASHVISDRLGKAFDTRTVEVSVPASKFLDGGDEAVYKVRADIPAQADNDIWVKYTKNWGDLRGGANYHGSAISGGYDRALSKNWRGGLFVSYNETGFSAASGGGNVYDTRAGIYGLYHKDASDAYVYMDFGWVRNKLRRGISSLGLGAEAKFGSHIMELGGEYRYDLHAKDGKTWHVSPYANLQLSYLRQGAYEETGAGIYNQQVARESNTYFAGQIGLELKRELRGGSYGMRFGVKHAFAGADPELSFHYEGSDGRQYTLKNKQDKTHFICSLFGETEFAKGWFAGGEAQLQKGAHDKDIVASLQLRRVW